jgi:hypothetical protein
MFLNLARWQTSAVARAFAAFIWNTSGNIFAHCGERGLESLCDDARIIVADGLGVDRPASSFGGGRLTATEN